jgi:hypothetical protein
MHLKYKFSYLQTAKALRQLKDRHQTLRNLLLLTRFCPNFSLNLTTEILLIGLEIVAKDRCNLFQRLLGVSGTRKNANTLTIKHHTSKKRDVPQPIDTSI